MQLEAAREQRDAATQAFAPDRARGAQADRILDAYYGLGSGPASIRTQPVGAVSSEAFGKDPNAVDWDATAEAIGYRPVTQTYSGKGLSYASNDIRAAGGDPSDLGDSLQYEYNKSLSEGDRLGSYGGAGSLRSRLQTYSQAAAAADPQSQVPLTQADIEQIIANLADSRIANTRYGEDQQIVGDEFAALEAQSEDTKRTMLDALTESVRAWDTNAKVARDRAVDEQYSRGFVNGRVGLTQRGVAQVEQDYAREREMFDRQQRVPILQRRQDQGRDNLTTRLKRADQALVNYRSDLDTSRGNFLNYVGNQSSRGQGAVAASVGAGQVFSTAAGNAYQQAGAAQANGAIARGRADADLYSSLGRAAGDAFGAYTAPKGGLSGYDSDIFKPIQPIR